MEYIKRERNLENYTIRSIPKSVLITGSDGKKVIDTSNSKYYYGTIPDYKIDKEGDFILSPQQNKITNTIDINIFLLQDLDDIGIYTDKFYLAKNQLLTQEPSGFDYFKYGRLAGAPLSFYNTPFQSMTGTTDDSYLLSVASLIVDDNNQPVYNNGLNVAADPINTFSGVISQNNQGVITYIIGGLMDTISNTFIPNTGVEFTTYTNEIVYGPIQDGAPTSWKKTIFKFSQGGWNIDNTSLQALMKQEEYLGVVFPPEIQSDVLIERGVADIFERHAILSEIKTTDDMDNFRGGYLIT